jgi:regulator of nucleoside diphosphate kinase
MTNLFNSTGGTELRPQLIVTEPDHRSLTALALAGIGHNTDLADDLLFELERAQIVAANAAPNDAVRMGSAVTYRDDRGQTRTVTLVYPIDADISAGRVSVMTPVGTALIGLRRGQSITWTGRDGHKHLLTVTDVIAPSA